MTDSCRTCGAPLRASTRRVSPLCRSCQRRPEYVPSPTRYSGCGEYPETLLAPDRAIGERWYAGQMEALLERYGAPECIPSHERLNYDWR